jgi:hypothetical protein
MDETGAKITELDSILGADVAGSDLTTLVDISDTTMATSGTNKKLTIDELGKIEQTLINKTIDGDDNTLQDIPYSAIKEEAWTSWTPTWTNLTKGAEYPSSNEVCHYVRIGNIVMFRGFFKFGANTTIGGNVSLDLPVSKSNEYKGFTPIGQARFFDANGIDLYGFIDSEGSVQVYQTGGTYLNDHTVTSTVPFTWTENDFITFQGFYQVD